MKPEAKSASGFLIEPDYRTPNSRRVVKINDANSRAFIRKKVDILSFGISTMAAIDIKNAIKETADDLTA